jgi:hypothetical protein
MPMQNTHNWIGIALLVMQGALLIGVSGLAWRLWQRLRVEQSRRASKEAEPSGRAAPAARSSAWPSGPPRIDPRQVATPVARASRPILIRVPSLKDAAGQKDREDAGVQLARLHAPIWERAERGQTAAEIAGATGRPLGEVEVVLALRRRIVGMRTRNRVEDRA